MSAEKLPEPESQPGSAGGPEPGKARALPPGRELIFALFFLALFGLQGIEFIRSNSVTYDEGPYLAAGVSYWRTGDFRTSLSNPPLLKELCALPLLALGAPFPSQEGFRIGNGILLVNEMAAAYPGRFHNLAMAGRAVILLLSLGFGLWLWFDAVKKYGAFAGRAAVILFAFQPVLIAHGAIAATDAGAALTFYLAARVGLGFQAQGWNYKRAVLFGLALGAALSSRYTNWTLLFSLPVAVLLTGRVRTDPTPFPARWAKGAGRLGIALFTALLLLNSLYGFQGTFRRLDAYRFQSRRLATAARYVPGWIRVPLPYYLTMGIDWQSLEDPTGPANNRTYWQGKWVSGRNLWLYPWLLATKLTIPLLLLAAVALGLGIYDRRRPGGLSAPRTRQALAVLAIMTIHFFVIGVVLLNYVGFRVLLALVPYLILFAGGAAARLAALVPSRFRPRAVILVILIGSSLVTAASSRDDYLAYNNALLGSDQRAARLDPDNCRDWGQQLIALKAWMEQNRVAKIYLAYSSSLDPKYYGINWEIPPPGPAPGWWAVATSLQRAPSADNFTFVRDLNIMEVRSDHPYFDWLNQYQPVGVIGKTMAIYHLE